MSKSELSAGATVALILITLEFILDWRTFTAGSDPTLSEFPGPWSKQTFLCTRCIKKNFRSLLNRLHVYTRVALIENITAFKWHFIFKTFYHSVLFKSSNLIVLPMCRFEKLSHSNERPMQTPKKISFVWIEIPLRFLFEKLRKRQSECFSKTLS